ncbi:MAG TPA: DUF3147 family protein, partial [Steroidobacteraceae bacterium]
QPCYVEQRALARTDHALRTRVVVDYRFGGLAVAHQILMMLSFDPSALRSIEWHQYLVRFLLGGLVTVIAGVLAKAFGPVFGGLFLAFPAIFPASITLIAKRERRKKACQRLNGKVRARRAAALDAAGTVLGTVGLGCFAWIVWKGLPTYPEALVLCGAAALWLMVSASLWWLRKKHWRPLRATR